MIRPYCESCKLIWSKHALHSVKHCTTCNQPVTQKEFYPEWKMIGGIVVIIIALFTLVSDNSNFIWIGGFLFGATLIYNGWNQSNELSELDEEAKPYVPEQKPKHNDPPNPNMVAFTCGQCSTKISVPKEQGIVKIKCPDCSREFNVRS